MKIRPRSLPPGWYPGDAGQVKRNITDFLIDAVHTDNTIYSGIVPHAGWGFSGSIACRVISKINSDHDTIVVVGGHLPPGDIIYAAYEEGYSTPLGILEADLELLGEIKKQIDVKEDIYADNTVEIQLPFIKFLYPDSLVLGMRVSPSSVAVTLGEVISLAARQCGKKVVVIGSTDLTHYGSNYGFSPQGEGKQAVQWVKNVNDKKFIDACIAMDTGAAIDHANKYHSACSAGGAVCAVGYAKQKGVEKGFLLEYATSWDIHPSESFVGYAGILFS